MKKVLLILCLFACMVMLPASVSAQNIVAISAGPDHCIALDSDGNVYEWGSNIRGELTGVRDRNPHYVPLRLPITNVSAVSAGSFHNLALKDDGTVWTWGDMPNKYWGNNTASFKLIQVPVTNVTAIHAGREWALAVKDDGTVWAWGMNFQGNFGDGTSEDFSVSPVCQLMPVPARISDVRYLDTNGEGCFAVTDDGSVWAWGSNVFSPSADPKNTAYGLLGDFSTNETRPAPFKVGMLSDVKAISQGTEHVLVLKDDGSVWAWGTDYNGQLGDGGKTQQMDPSGQGFVHQYASDLVKSKIDDVKAISARSLSSMALKNDGTVWVWGITYDVDQVNRLTTPPYISVPKKAEGLNDVTSISIGGSYYAALKSDGTVWVWGHNQWGQAGDRVGGYVTTPLQMSFDTYKEIPDPEIISYNLTELPSGKMITPTPTAFPVVVNATGTPLDVSPQPDTNTSQATSGDGRILMIAGFLGLIILLGGCVYVIRRK